MDLIVGARSKGNPTGKSVAVLRSTISQTARDHARDLFGSKDPGEPTPDQLVPWVRGAEHCAPEESGHDL